MRYWTPKLLLNLCLSILLFWKLIFIILEQRERSAGYLPPHLFKPTNSADSSTRYVIYFISFTLTHRPLVKTTSNHQKTSSVCANLELTVLAPSKLFYINLFCKINRNNHKRKPPWKISCSCIRQKQQAIKHDKNINNSRKFRIKYNKDTEKPFRKYQDREAKWKVEIAEAVIASMRSYHRLFFSDV